LLGWATARVAGRWAGLAAAAAALVVGPFAFRSLHTVIFHVLAPFTAAILAAYLVLLPRRLPRVLAAALAAAVGVLAGANAASDALVWVGAIAPFAIAAAVLAWATRRVDIAVRSGITIALAVTSALVTNWVMHGLGFHVVGSAFPLAHPGDLPGNTVHLGRMAALLGGANYALPDGYPTEPLRILVAGLVVAALAAVVVAAVRQLARRSDPLVRAFACYWAVATVLVGLSFVVTRNATALGAGSANYLLTLPLAAGAGVAMLAAGSRRAQIFVSLAIAVVGAVNIAGIVQGRAGTSAGAVGRYEGPLVRLLERKGVTRGYAGYWDAQNLSWESDLRLFVAPIVRCDVAEEPRLCGYNFSTIRSWFVERPGPSFLIVDPTTSFITEPPPVVDEAAESYRFGPLTVYVFTYDLARHIRPPRA
jgi:hypothetical protein